MRFLPEPRLDAERAQGLGASAEHRRTLHFAFFVNVGLASIRMREQTLLDWRASSARGPRTPGLEGAARAQSSA
eukprot:6100589-Pyramimonas_sp.AAC.1